MNTRGKHCRAIFLSILLSILLMYLIACSFPKSSLPTQLTTNPPSIPEPPQLVSSLTAEAISSTSVRLEWIDNQPDIDGWKIYRDNNLIGESSSNIFTDSGLQPNITYQYSVTAYNKAGESGAIAFIVITPNPPISVSLTAAGVYDNRENLLRGEDGEVYLYIVVSDAKTTSGILRFPQAGGEHYKLAKDGIEWIATEVFSTDEVGEYLTLTIIGFEDDGGGFEPFVYEALSIAVESQLPTGTGLLLSAFDIELSDVIGQFFGEEDDWLGSYEQTWDSNSNWGIGEYADVACVDERGVECLRLWFSISTQ